MTGCGDDGIVMTTFHEDLQQLLPDGDELLMLGVTGSTAYGLDHADSDVDRLGIYAVPTERVLGFGFVLNDASQVWTEPDDVQLHDIGKYLHLVLNGNPTVTELLYLADYEFVDPRMQSLLDNRHRLLGAHRVRKAYIGYAVAQAKRLQNREANGKKGFNSDLAKRTAKHGRHCFRLLLQGEQLLTEGTLTVNVADKRDELFAVGELAEKDIDAFIAKYEEVKARVVNVDAVIPDEPDREWAEQWLIDFRRSGLISGRNRN